MKIDAINFGAFTGTSQLQTITTEETGSSPDDFDDTRVAKQPVNENKVSSPIEKKNGTIEDLMSMQASTEKMAHSYGFSNVEQAASSSSNSSAVSGVSGMAFKA